MLRYKLRTLLILLAILPPAVAASWGLYSWLAVHRHEAETYALVFSFIAIPVAFLALAIYGFSVLIQSDD